MILIKEIQLIDYKPRKVLKNNTLAIQPVGKEKLNNV